MTHDKPLGACQTGALTSVMLQQDYGGVNCASTGVNRAGCDTVLNVWPCLKVTKENTL